MVLKLIRDDWIAGRLSMPVHRLDVADGAAPDLESVNRILKNSGDSGLVYCRIKPTNMALLHCLEDAGFRIVDTALTLEKPVSTACVSTQGVRPARDEDRQGVREVAGTSFSYSRFHMDQFIPRGIADKIKADWAENYFLGRRGDMMIVSENGGRITGFLQLLYNGDTMIIDLIATAKEARRQGRAAGMISSAQMLSPQCRRVRVGTQAANIPSLRLYESLGFRMVEMHYIFHFHANRAF